MPPRLRTWLQLLRAPNLFTVPGDPLAGFLFSNMGEINGTLVLVMVASLCFYGAGLLHNDLADEAEDRRERPQRPLPSGAATRGSVRAAMCALNAAGLLVLYFTDHPVVALKVGGALVIVVWLYNRVTKGWPVIGALNMGACRGLSVMLGAFTGPVPFPIDLGLPVAMIFTLYIAAVTNLARHETRPHVPILARLLPILPVTLGALALSKFALFSPAKVPAVAIFGLAVASTAWLLVKMFRSPAPPLPPLIGAHIRVLLPLQAAVCYSADPWAAGRIAAIVLLACWPLSREVSRRFYAS